MWELRFSDLLAFCTSWCSGILIQGKSVACIVRQSPMERNHLVKATFFFSFYMSLIICVQVQPYRVSTFLFFGPICGSSPLFPSRARKVVVWVLEHSCLQCCCIVVSDHSISSVAHYTMYQRLLLQVGYRCMLLGLPSPLATSDYSLSWIQFALSQYQVSSSSGSSLASRIKGN